MKDRAKLVAALALIGMVALFAVIHFAEAIDRREAESAAARVEYRRNDPDANACREHGGMPIWSSWSGDLVGCKPLDCKPLPVKPEPPTP